MYALVYVDDILVATNNELCKELLFNKLNSTYGIKDQGLLTQYLGIGIDQTKEHITIRQSKYVRDILHIFGYENAHAVSNPMEVNAHLITASTSNDMTTEIPYREAIRMLMYLVTSARPDLIFALGQLSRFVAHPSSKHIGTLKRVLRYLVGTQKYGITYT